MTIAEAHKYVRYAALLGFLGGTVTLLFMFQQMIAHGEVALWLAFDVLILFVLSYGIHRRSRAAATLMFVYFVANRFLMWRVLVETEMLLIGIVFAVLFLQGARATFYLRRSDREI